MNGRIFRLAAAFCGLAVLVACSSNDQGNPVAAEDPATAGMAVTTVAGLAGQRGSVDGVGSAARLSVAWGMAYDGAGTIYFADCGSYTVKTLDINTGTVTTIAGLPAPSVFRYPTYVALSGGAVYVADTQHQCIRAVNGGAVFLVAGDPRHGATLYQDGNGLNAAFGLPLGLAVAGGYLYISDSFNHAIRRMDLGTFDVSTFAGNPGVAGTKDGVGTAAEFNTPNGLATDGSYLYVADWGNHTIRKVDLLAATAGAVSTIAGRVGISGFVDGANAAFNHPSCLAMYQGSSLLIIDSYNTSIRKWSAGVTTTLAGGPGKNGYQDGPLSTALFNSPSSVVAVGNAIYVSDAGNYVIRKIY